jgi:hypothetical protein
MNLPFTIVGVAPAILVSMRSISARDRLASTWRARA